MSSSRSPFHCSQRGSRPAATPVTVIQGTADVPVAYDLGGYGWGVRIQTIGVFDGNGQPDFIFVIGGANSSYEALLLSTQARPGRNPPTAYLASWGCSYPVGFTPALRRTGSEVADADRSSRSDFRPGVTQTSLAETPRTGSVRNSTS